VSAYWQAVLGLPGLPDSARRSLRLECVTELTVPLALALLEGGIAGVLAAKLFGASPWIVTLVTAAPMYGNLSSVLWGRLAEGRGKVRTTVLLQLGTLALIVLMATSPFLPGAVGWFLGSYVGARFLLAGVITVRSVVWSLNYPRALRARITGRLQLLFSLATLTVTVIAGRLLDQSPDAFPTIALSCVALALVGVAAMAFVHVPGDAEHRAREKAARAEAGGRLGLWRLLREDRDYRRYQTAQFLAGSANMMIEAPFVYLVSVELGAGYLLSFTLSMVLPWFLGMVTLPLWALFLDQVHVTRFRARQSLLWIGSQGLLCLGGLTGALWLLAASRILLGIARGGGVLAWQLGHNDFAKPEALGGYMAAHVTLTGLRGLTAPFLGMLLYQGATLGPVVLPGIGAWVYAVAALLSALAWWLFLRLDGELTGREPAPGTPGGPAGATTP
jgi:MFS family permease